MTHELFGRASLGSMAAEQMRKFAGNGDIKLVHSISGRRRYYDGRIKWDNGYAKKIESYLTKVTEINKVTLNRLTGSIVITYSCPEETVDKVFRKFGGFPGKGNVRKRVHFIFSHINKSLYRTTGGNLDLPTSLAGIFLVLGLSRTIRLKQCPTGPK
ncbi:hypothetical protein N752_28735 [Desulforamulus aquiferis]|nr:hypothetical protein [Desulforamulus aquiferis]RYD01564.1 hypothetical protein N752_28735 [Desulforamulus aquiferis]